MACKGGPVQPPLGVTMAQATISDSSPILAAVTWQCWQLPASTASPQGCWTRGLGCPGDPRLWYTPWGCPGASVGHTLGLSWCPCGTQPGCEVCLSSLGHSQLLPAPGDSLSVHAE